MTDEITMMKLKDIHPYPGNPRRIGKDAADTVAKLRQYALPEDRNIGQIMERMVGKSTYFNYKIVGRDRICPTITASTRPIRKWDWTYFTDEDIVACSTFPTDYDFCGQDPCYVCGMSVPPKLMQTVAGAVKAQWLDREGRA